MKATRDCLPTGRPTVAALLFGCVAVGTFACREREAWPAPRHAHAHATARESKHGIDQRVTGSSLA